MNESNIYHRRKKQKSNRTKSLTSKKKRKSRLTREYCENEKEVQMLLENTRFSIELNEHKGTVSPSVSQEFFCMISEDESTGTTQITESDSTVIRHTERTADNEDSDGSVDNDEPGDSVTKTSSERSSTHGNQKTASTYIQIVEDAVLQLSVGIKFNFNNGLLFTPGSQLNSNIKMNERELRPNSIRMLNRFYEETGQVSKELLETVINAQDGQFFVKDTALYRTVCEHKFHPIFCEPTADVVEIPTRKFIKLNIKELIFTQHPQLLEEHRLSNLLEDMYEKYTKRLQSKICEKLKAELLTERKIVNELLKTEAHEGGLLSPVSEEKRALRLEHHLLGLKALRNKLYLEEVDNKELLEGILDTWIKLKNLRKTQGYQCTRFKLQIKLNESPNVVNEKHKWSQRYENDLKEIYREELETYYHAKRLWKNRNSENVNITKPKKPDIAKLSEELKGRMAQCLPAPGEPKIEIKLNRVSDEEFFDIPGQHKLKSFFMKIYFDQEFVSITRNYRMEPDLRISVNEAFGIFLERRLPKNIRIMLYEKSKIPPPKKIADITLPFTFTAQNDEYQIQNVNFSSQTPKIAGRLCVCFQCDEETDTHQMLTMLFPPSRELRSNLQTGIVLDKCKNISNHTEEIKVSDQGDGASIEMKPKSTCTFEEYLLQWCTIDELEHNQRFRLLRSRYFKNDARTKDIRFISSLENELEFDWEEEEEAVIDAGNWIDPIDLHNHQGKKYLKSLYEAIRNQCVRLSKVMENNENLLIGDELASLSGFFQALALIFQPRRPLNPIRNNVRIANAVPLMIDSNQKFNVVFNVVRATGIPVRNTNYADTDSRQRSSGSSNLFITQNLKYSNVKPFIALSFKDKLCRTMTADGSSPTWNEQLVLQLSGNLTGSKDDIKISLFDEVIENHLSDDVTVRNMDIYQRIQTNWLGEYRIPMSTILTRQKIEGVFELNTPKVLLGYKRPSLDNITTNSDTSIAMDQYPEIKENVYLWFYISIEPNYELQHVNTACLECSELKDIRQYLNEWTLQIRALQLKRQIIEPLICTVNGKSACITRLLEPIPLPMEASENMVESVCRYVALLKILNGYDACMGFRGVWLNNQILLETTWGSAKDLGVLLCNLLLSIGVPCWLVLGISSPYGESAFVLYCNSDGDKLLINPCSGKHYTIKDVFCPLSNISFVIAQDNIYCNVQTETRATMTNFNFTDSSCWLAAFNKKNPAPIGGIQKLNYIYRIPFTTLELRKNIERKIMKKISSWRTMRKTIWNRAFQSRLQTILQMLEHFTTFTSSSSNEETNFADQLNAAFPSYKIYGFAINFSYTNLTSISDRIKSTGIHLNSDKAVQFSLAVHVHAYPNNILSVWIFIISIIPV